MSQPRRRERIQNLIYRATVFVLLLGVDLSATRAQQLWPGVAILDSPPERWEIIADQMEISKEKVIFRGQVEAWAAGVWVKAENLEIDRGGGTMTFSGGVNVEEGTSRLSARRLEFRREPSQVLMEQAEIFVKLRKRTTGATGLFLGGRRLVFREGRYHVEEARFTTCDCPSGVPSWSICSWKAEAEPEQGAWLSWPVLRVLDVPLFVLPVAYVPLNERRSGFLFPQFNYSGRDGVVLSDAFFLTLGRSADTTLSLDWFEERGWRERVQFRARPSATSSLVLNAALLWKDSKVQETNPSLARRWALEGGGKVAGERFFLRAALNLYSDSDYVRDFASELTGRASDKALSSLRMEWAGDGYFGEAGALYVQDLRFGQVDLFQQKADGLPSTPADTIHRLGVWDSHVGPMALAGWPLWFTARAQLVNFSSFSAAWRDWGPDGLPNVLEPKYGQTDSSDGSRDDGAGGEGDGHPGNGELRRAVRLLVHTALELRKIWQELAIHGWLEQKQLVYLPHGPGALESSVQGTFAGGLEIWTELLGRWKLFTHRVRPALALATAQDVRWSSGTWNFFDLEDRPQADGTQLVADLDNMLVWRKEKIWGSAPRLDLRLRQGFDLGEGQLGQLVAQSDFTMGWLRLGAYLGWDWNYGKVAEIKAESRLNLSSRVELWTSYINLLSVFDEAGRPVVLSERFYRRPELYQGLDTSWLVGMGESLQALQVRVNFGPLENLRLFGEGMLEPQKPQLYLVGGGLAYDSVCKCWSLSLVMRYLRGQNLPDVFVSFQLAGVTSAAASSGSRF